MKKWLLFPILLCEFFSFYLLLSSPLVEFHWHYYIGLHTVACVSFTYISWLLLQQRLPLLSYYSLAFLFAISALMPVFGMLGICFAIFAAIYRQRDLDRVTWIECERPILPPYLNQLTPMPYGRGALREILINETEPLIRAQAIGAIGHLSRRQAIPLLQFALKDLSDDVRLLAFASLETIETQINESLALLKKQFSYNKQANSAYQIAQQFWELCYLGLADATLRSYYLEQALIYLHQANALEENASHHLLLGRVMLAQARPDDALTYLRLALNGGLLKTQVLPYLAEASYMLGDYQLSKQYIRQFPDRKGDKLNQIKEYWL